MININSCVSITQNEFESNKLDDEWIIVDKNQEKVAIMNETAFLVWSCVKRKRTIFVHELCSNILDKFPEEDKKQIECDVIEIINLMVQEQLLYEL